MAPVADEPALPIEAATALVRAATRLADAVEPDAVLSALADAAVPHLADWCAIHVAERGGLPELAAVAHADTARGPLARALHERVPPRPDRGVGLVIVSGRRQLVADVDCADPAPGTCEREHLAALRELGVRSIAVLPLSARGRVLGALSLVFAESARRYDEGLLAAAEALASQAALVLDNARLYAEQANVARTLQRSLLPDDLPEIPGVELAVRYRPAGRANAVGGDFYDVLVAGDGSWRIVVGDVAGKGAEAAALTSLVRHTLAAAILRDGDPTAALALVNDALRAREGVVFCTVAYGTLRCRDDGVALEMLTAGHPPVLILRADGRVEPLCTRGPVLGVLPELRLEGAEALLAPGDAAVLYTDGATEVRGVRPSEGERALRETLARAAGRPAAEIVERIEHHTLVLGGGAPRDDLALLAIRALSSPC